MHVEIWMSKKVLSISPSHSLAAAQSIFEENKIRRLPIVQDENLIGILARDDLRKALPSMFDAEAEDEINYLMEHTTVESIMTRAPVTVKPRDTIMEAARKMKDNKIDGLPVVENGSLVGIISITDVLAAFLEIAGTEGGGTRFDLRIGRNPDSFYGTIHTFQQNEKEIVAITQHYDFSPDSHLLTVQTRDEDNEELLKALWEKGITVDKVTIL